MAVPVMAEPLDSQRLALGERKITTPKQDQVPSRQRRSDRFLKGPIPWYWLTSAAQQPGQALHVAIVIWFLSGLKKSRTIALSGSVLRTMGVNRHAGYRGLIALEKAALVTVERHPGRNPVVTILDTPSDHHE